MIPTRDIPQANRLDRVGDLIALVNAGIESDRALAQRLGIVPRQVKYYKEAARILDLAEPEDGRGFRLTDRGKAYLAATRPDQKFEFLVEAVRDSTVIRVLLSQSTEAELNKHCITSFLKRVTTLSGSTPARRADTLVAWLKHITEFDPESFVSVAQHAAKRAPDDYRKYMRGGEGPLHRGLKEAVANNPSLLEDGLKLVQMEYRFPTNDRADILFLDAKSRYLGVEVEVDVGKSDVVGLLQAVKYKAMLAPQFGVGEKDVRGMLVARSIDPHMQWRAKQYNIDTREVTSVI